jgi:VIT1/CCC1 family predicted Fe2+/Mn2+ transporter
MSTRRASFRVRHGAKPKESILDHLLDPIDRLSEAVYSILIVLTFTLAYSILRLGDYPESVAWAGYGNQLFFAVLGATLAWGLIDGIMYALMSIFERGEKHRLLQQLQAAKTEAEGIALIGDELDFILEPITSEEQRRLLYQDALPYLRAGRMRPVGLQRDDLTGAFGSALVALIAVAPSLVPLYFLSVDLTLAIRVSNIVSFAVLFALGFSWGRYTGANSWKTGLGLAAIGLIMVLIAIPLGG